MIEYWLYVALPYATYGVVVGERGRVVKAAPIAQWMVGKSWDAVVWPWLDRKKATVVLLPNV